jgi:hypothetical protein
LSFLIFGAFAFSLEIWFVIEVVDELVIKVVGWLVDGLLPELVCELLDEDEFSIFSS